MAPEMMTIEDRLNLSDWNLETGYKTKSSGEDYPRRIFSALKKSGIRVDLRAYDEDIEYVCSGYDVPGYTFYVHTPGTAVQLEDLSVDVSHSEAVQISIKPKLITTSDGLRNYRIDQRKCFFNSERKLNFFQLYSQSNCEIECLTDYTLQDCGCVMFFMPSKLI